MTGLSIGLPAALFVTVLLAAIGGEMLVGAFPRGLPRVGYRANVVALLVVAALTVVAARGAPAWLPMAGVALAALIAGHVVGDLRARLERKRADGILDVLSQELHRRNEAHGRTHYALAIATGGQFHVANATFKTANLALAAYTYGDDCWVGDQEITPDELRYMAANEVPDVPEDARS